MIINVDVSSRYSYCAEASWDDTGDSSTADQRAAAVTLWINKMKKSFASWLTERVAIASLKLVNVKMSDHLRCKCFLFRCNRIVPRDPSSNSSCSDIPFYLPASRRALWDRIDNSSRSCRSCPSQQRNKSSSGPVVHSADQSSPPFGRGWVLCRAKIFTVRRSFAWYRMIMKKFAWADFSSSHNCCVLHRQNFAPENWLI